MNPLLLAAAILTVLVGAAHSYLGERFILIPLSRREDLPRLLGDVQLTKHTLRLAWHITTVLALGFAAQLVSVDRVGVGTLVRIFAVASAGSGVIALVVSRGKHLSWIFFFAIAGLAWLGAR